MTMDTATQTNLSFESQAMVDFRVVAPKAPAEATPPHGVTSPPTPLRSRSPVETPLFQTPSRRTEQGASSLITMSPITPAFGVDSAGRGSSRSRRVRRGGAASAVERAPPTQVRAAVADQVRGRDVAAGRRASAFPRRRGDRPAGPRHARPDRENAVRGRDKKPLGDVDAPHALAPPAGAVEPRRVARRALSHVGRAAAQVRGAVELLRARRRLRLAASPGGRPSAPAPGRRGPASRRNLPPMWRKCAMHS